MFLRRRDGIGSIVGAVFFIAIALVAFITFQLLTIYMADYQRSLIEYDQLNVERSQEVLSVILSVNANRVNIMLCNRGSVTVVVHRVWVIGTINATDVHNYIELNMALAPAECSKPIIYNITRYDRYLVKIITLRGNIFSNVTGG